jgi:hypothetical protein
MVIADSSDSNEAAGHEVTAALAQVCALDRCEAIQRWSVVECFIARAVQTLDLPDGLRLELPLTGAAARDVAEFVRVERECCARFTYSVGPGSSGRTLQLDIRAQGDDVAALKTLYLGRRP